MAKLVDQKSHPSSSSVLDLFSVPPTQVSFEQGYWQELQLANSCTNEGPYKFNVQSDPHYLHLARNYLWIQARIVKPKKAVITDADSVGPINILGKTLIKQVVVLCDGQPASDSGPLYAYRTYFETELNYSKASKESLLSPAMYRKDTPAAKVDTAENIGWKARAEEFKGSKTVELMAPIHCDLFNSDRLLLSNTEITLELYRNSDEFCLITATSQKYHLEILDMKWYIRKLQVMDSVHLGIESVLAKTPARYPLRRILMTHQFVAIGRHTVPSTPIFNGQLPRRVVIGFISENAFHGDLNLSPFVFSHHNVKSIQLEAGGQFFPRTPIKADYANNNFARAYLQMLEGLGCTDENKSNDIDPEHFKNCSCFYVFDLTPEETDSTHWQLIRDGSVVVHCEFTAAVGEPGLEMIVYGEFDNLALIDRTRTIHYDYST
jgi:hypothetical protein